MGKKRFIIKTILYILLFLAILIFVIRSISEKQIDDVSPGIQCEKGLIEKTDILFVIPKFDNKSIAENKEWCGKIRKTGKKLGMHGVYHAYNEFLQDRSEVYLEDGIKIFEECFNQTPAEFKPPQLKISENNEKMINTKMKLNLMFNQITHKVYHCSDTGKFPNWLIDFI